MFTFMGNHIPKRGQRRPWEGLMLRNLALCRYRILKVLTRSVHKLEVAGFGGYT